MNSFQSVTTILLFAPLPRAELKKVSSLEAEESHGGSSLTWQASAISINRPLKLNRLARLMSRK